MNRVRVTICEKDYFLKTEETAGYYQSLARKVEAAAQEMIDSGGLSAQSAMALAALSAFDEAQKANDSTDNIRTQIKEYVNEACCARAERDEAVRRAQALEAKVKELEAKAQESGSRSQEPGSRSKELEDKVKEFGRFDAPRGQEQLSLEQPPERAKVKASRI